jgi:Ca2+:H+ antiporter
LASLAERLGYVTEQLASYTNDTLGGLLNATFGNATEVIIAGFAIRRRYLRLVKLTLLGSIVSNLLLVLGCAFLAGGVAGHATQRFNKQGVAVNVGLLTLASVAVALPTLLSETQAAATVAQGVEAAEAAGTTAAAAAAGATTTPTPTPTTPTSQGPELWLSRFESVLMLACYALFLVFQLFTHRHLYEEDQQEQDEEAAFVVQRRGDGAANGANGPSREASFAGFVAANGKQPHEVEMGAMRQDPHHERASLLGGSGGAAAAGPSSSSAAAATTTAPAPQPAAVFEEEEPEQPDLTLSSCLVWMALVTLAISLLSDAVTAAIADAATTLRMPLPFLATIVLPIVGNAAEHFSAVTFAARNRMEISLGVAVGSSTQVAVLVVPFCVVLAWCMGAPLDLNFYAFEAFVLFASVLLATVVVQDGTGNWLKGALLLVSYFFVAGGFWVHRDQSLEEEGGVVH